MKKNILFSMFASMLLLGSCDYNEDNFPGYDDLTHPKDVRNVEIVLANSDYKVIAELDSNKGLALSKDPEGKTYAAALEAVAKNKYFTEDAQALWYLPAYIDKQHPYLSDGSKVTVKYNNFENLPDYLKSFNAISAYELNSADYKSVWGESITASFLSPSTVNQIPAILAAGVKNPADGATRLVEYAYSTTEPSTGGGTTEPEVKYTKIADVLSTGAGTYDVKGEVVATYGQGFLLNDGTGSILVYIKATANYSVGDVVTVSGDASKYNGMFQFAQTAKVAFAERNTTFVYPTATNMSGAEMDAWAAAPVSKYVTITGKLLISGNYYNLVVDGSTRQGSISYPIAGVVDKELADKEVKATGYLIGATSKFVNMMATSVVAADATSDITPIGVAALSNPGSYKVKGVVAATYSRGFLLTDGTGNILVYKTTECQVGDVMVVSGTISKYGGLMQYPNTSEVTKVDQGAFAVPAPQVMGAAEMDAYLTAPRVAYVTYEGTLKIDGNYYNVLIEGASTAQGSLSYPATGLVNPELDGKKVVVTGYAIGVSSSKFINTMTTSVVEATAATAKMFASTRAGSPAPNTSAIYQYSAADKRWNKYSASGVKVAALQPADYQLMGSSYVSNPTATLPIYLQRTYPYAKANDVAAVAYYTNSDKAISASEFVFDGAAWVETTVSVPTSIVFLKNQDTWTEAKVYYSSSLLDGDDGGFTIQDVELGGLEKVWVIDKKFGWKGSGFSGTNRKTESWIVSPVISLKKSAAPVLKFDVAINYLRGADRAEHFNVLVSTDYNDDVTTATWKTLEVEGWPEEDSWTFVTITPADMSAYKDKEVRIAFCYKSSESAASTVEVKNVSIQE